MSEIKKLITQGEGRKLEFKESLPANEKIIKTAVAFSNSQGGKLVIGIGNEGTDAKVFLDQATFDGNIIDSIEKSMDFIKKNIKLGAKIGEVYRENKWQYPLLALREVIVNAIVHRDYAIMGSDIKIAIFDDMIEITSPGFLIIDKEKLGSGYSSTFTQVKFILQEEGISDNEGVNSLFDFIAQNPNKRTTQISNELNISVKTLERWIKQLKNEEKIEFRGSPKTGGYFVK